VRFASRSGGLFAVDLDYRIIAKGDVGYPEMLEHLSDPPQRVWVAGRDLATLPPCVAIVGTRSPTHYGREVAAGLAADFARSGMCVVSGLARGIDSWAHSGALDNGTTVGVLPGGIDRCYPSSNRELYERIADEGTLVAEVEPGTPTHKRRFTHRNRIIAALSLAVVVVQAAERSGALSTARHGLDIGREVFAVPGDIRVEVSAGVHGLIRDGAAVCAGAGDVLERIRPELERISARRTLDPFPEDLAPEHRAILGLLGGDVMTLGALAGATGLGASGLAVAVSKLELNGWIARGPGALVRRVR
jgi:DNA processing protein